MYASELAGLGATHEYGPIRGIWARLRAQGHAWLTAAAAHEGIAWADRALSVARLCLPDKTWGAVGADLAANPTATIPDPDACSVCYEDFDEMLPAAQGTTPTAAGRFACPHSLCRACDLAIQNGPNPRCPICRQPRTAWL